MNFNKKLASLDIGSNSVTLLLISYDKMGQIKILDELGAITKLGEGIRNTKILNPNAMKRTIDLCEEIFNIAQNEGAEKIIVTASSVIRNAINKTEFLVACHSRLNVFPQVLTGTEEANYIFSGAAYDYENIEGDIIILNVGGDTAEIIFGSKDMLVGLHSLDLGFIWLTEKFQSKNKLLNKIRSPLKKHIKKVSTNALQEVKFWLDGRQPTIICCGGNATTLASIHSKHNYNDRVKINKMICSINDARYIARRLGKMSLENRKTLLGLEHERAEFIHTGVYTTYTLLKLLGVSNRFHITTNGMRMGILKAHIEKTNSLT
jgi:exopolyphosphatase / guanosine-5'-triphosphate,3'-diphosphate pyrophosphatase